MNELGPLRKRVRELEDQFRDLMTGEGWSVGTFQDEGVPGHWELNYKKKGGSGGTGACCFPDGSCSVLTAQECRDAGGTFLANGTTCSPNPCSDFCSGACCRDDGSCDVQRESVCVAGGGAWQGCGTDCDPNPCPPTGACCVDGVCSITTEEECTGNYLGDGSTCADVDCTQGACCVDEVCSITAEADCTGSYFGDGSTCSPDPCPHTACLCPTFTSPYLPGRHFLTVMSHGSAINTATADCSSGSCTGDSCDSETDCIGTGAVMSYDPITCVLTDTTGTWNSINTRHNVCDGVDCVSVAPAAPTSGTYHADNVNFCGLNVAPLSFSTSGSTVHGHFIDDNSFGPPCNDHIVSTYDVFYEFSDECMV